MPSHEVKLVVSATIPLEKLEDVFNRKSQGAHHLGSERTSGALRKQSIWIGRLTPEAEFIEDSVEWSLAWLSSKYGALKSLDPDLKIKICCKLYVNRDPNGFLVNPRMAKMLSDLGVLLLLDVNQEAKSESDRLPDNE